MAVVKRCKLTVGAFLPSTHKCCWSDDWDLRVTAVWSSFCLRTGPGKAQGVYLMLFILGQFEPMASV